jgi:pimeloyl-ACP methyl ester carboxylesterase
MKVDGSTRSRAVLLLAMAAWSTAGCWNGVAEHCRGCTIVSERTPGLPRLAADTRAVVVLVHGAFGFGDEWRPVLDALEARPHVATLVFGWGGPWTRKPSLAAEALRRVVQSAVDRAPPGVPVVVIAHSAGGALASYVGERLRLPPGRRARIASIAAPEGMNLAPFEPEAGVNTPLGIAIGGHQPPLGPIAPGVEYVEYETADRPSEQAAARPSRPGVVRVYLGVHVGHNASVAKVAVPLVLGL